MTEHIHNVKKNFSNSQLARHHGKCCNWDDSCSLDNNPHRQLEILSISSAGNCEAALLSFLRRNKKVSWIEEIKFEYLFGYLLPVLLFVGLPLIS